MRRRTVLTGCSAILTGLLAGCGGGGGGGDGGGETTPTPDSSTETAEPTPTPTEGGMDTPTETATATPTPTPAGNVHDIGEQFSVGEGTNEVRYRIVELFRADRIGSDVNNVEADGTFVIVVLEFTNPQDSPTSFPRGDFRIQSAELWRRFDRQGSEKLAADERLNVGPIGDATVSANSSQTGAVAFDVDPDAEYRLWLTPPGEADTPEHFVPVGRPSELQELQGSLTG